MHTPHLYFYNNDNLCHCLFSCRSDADILKVCNTHFKPEQFVFSVFSRHITLIAIYLYLISFVHFNGSLIGLMGRDIRLIKPMQIIPFM